MNQKTALSLAKRYKNSLEEAHIPFLSVIVFGSVARNAMHEHSDVDIAVEIQSDNTFRSFFGLKAYLEDNLHTTVDLGMENAIKPGARPSIQQDIIYA